LSWIVNHVIPFDTCVASYFEEMDWVVMLLYIGNDCLGGGDVMKGNSFN
jgi:hypothetical protein